MGERLVVEIKRNDELLAASYYHWSAYTEPALNILKSMYDHVLSKASAMTDDQIQLALIRFAERSTYLGHFETNEARDEATRQCLLGNKDKPEAVRRMLEDLICTHGGIDPHDQDAACCKFPDEVFELENISRNEGLVAITHQSICDQLRWAEGVISINLDNNTVSNGIAYEYSIQEYLGETEEDDDEYYTSPDELPVSPISISEFSLNEIEIVLDVIRISQSSWIRYKDTIYQLKEG